MPIFPNKRSTNIAPSTRLVYATSQRSASASGVSIYGPAPYYPETFGVNCRFPSVNGLVPRNTTGIITYDRPPTEARFIAQVRAANP